MSGLGFNPAALARPQWGAKETPAVAIFPPK
jgi:hypothetical protein